MKGKNKKMLPTLQEVIFYANHPDTQFCSKLPPILIQITQVGITKEGQVRPLKSYEKTLLINCKIKKSQ
jgi:hypothetical protein